jgi:hypothetical protein
MERVLQPVTTSPIAAEKVWFQDEYIFVRLRDQRILAHPLSWYPHLAKGTDIQRQKVELWNEGAWLHWEELDEDLSAEGFLQFIKSGK